MMNLIFRILSWLREVGIILLTIPLFQVWFTSVRFERAVTGIDLITHDPLVFLCHFLVVSSYLSSRLKPTFTWKLAIAFSIAAPIFHAYVACSIPLGDRSAAIAGYGGVGGSTYDAPLTPGDDLLLSKLGMAIFAVGLLASMDFNSQIRYVVGIIMGFIVVFMPIYKCLVFLPFISLPIWLVGTGLGIGVGERVRFTRGEAGKG